MRTITKRTVICVQQGPTEFTTAEIAAKIGCNTTSSKLKGALATMAALGHIEHISRGHWRRVTAEPDWSEQALEAVRRLCALTPPREDPHFVAKRNAADHTVEKLLPLTGGTLLLDSGSQIVCCAEALTDGLRHADKGGRARFRGATVLTNNCLAFLELLSARVQGDLADLIVVGGEYVPALAAYVPSREASQVFGDGVAPIVLMSVSAVTQRGLYSHHTKQADWKRQLIESATSVYIVADSSKLLPDVAPDAARGGIFVGERQEVALWNRIWSESDTNVHVVVGVDPAKGLDEGQVETAKWLKTRLGDRFTVYPDCEQSALMREIGG